MAAMDWNETYGPDWEKNFFQLKKTPTGGTALDWNAMKKQSGEYFLGKTPQQTQPAIPQIQAKQQVQQPVGSSFVSPRRDMSSPEMTKEAISKTPGFGYGALPMIDMRMSARGLIKGQDGVWTPSEELQKGIDENYFKQASLRDQMYQKQAAEQEREGREYELRETARKEYEAAQQAQRDFDSGIGWALENPNAPGAAKYIAQLQQGRKIGGLPDSFADRLSKQEELRLKGVDAESLYGLRGAQSEQARQAAESTRAGVPYIAPSQEAENRFKTAQAGYYEGKNGAETRAAIAQSRASALARVLAANKQEKDYLQDPTKLKALAEIKALDPEMYAQFMANR